MSKSLKRRVSQLEYNRPGFGGLYFLRMVHWGVGEIRFLMEQDGTPSDHFICMLKRGETVPALLNPPWIIEQEEVVALVNKSEGWNGWKGKGLRRKKTTPRRLPSSVQIALLKDMEARVGLKRDGSKAGMLECLLDEIIRLKKGESDES